MPKPSGQTGCVWMAEITAPVLHPLLQDTETVVIGAGIVGQTTALRLLELAHPVTVLEGLRAGRQVTGRSSAKITTQHRLIYHHLGFGSCGLLTR